MLQVSTKGLSPGASSQSPTSGHHRAALPPEASGDGPSCLLQLPGSQASPQLCLCAHMAPPCLWVCVQSASSLKDTVVRPGLLPCAPGPCRNSFSKARHLRRSRVDGRVLVVWGLQSLRCAGDGRHRLRVVPWAPVSLWPLEALALSLSPPVCPQVPAPSRLRVPCPTPTLSGWFCLPTGSSSVPRL